MAKKYINADLLRQKMYHEAFETDSDLQKWDSGCWIRYKMFENCMDDIPKADVRENVRGEWKRFPSDSALYKCSVCYRFGDTEWSFCPSCGADMRGEKDDERRSD